MRRPAAAWQALLDRGVLVRDVGLPGWLRVTAGTPQETDAFLTAMEHCREHGERRVERTTKETKVVVEIDLDGTGQAEISTGVGFYDHMLHQIARHGGFDLTVQTVGDLEIDAHHTIEDTALALGAAFAEALGDKAGIRRYGSATVPMDEVLVQAAVDLSGRPYVVHDEPPLAPYIGPVYPTSMTRHIWESFGHAAQVTLHVTCCGRPGRAATPTRTTWSRRSSRRSRGRCARPSRSTRAPAARCRRTKGAL